MTIASSNTSLVQETNTSVPSQIPGFDPWELVTALRSSVYLTEPLMFGAAFLSPGNTTSENLDTFWFWLNVTNPQQSIADLKSAQFMMTTFQDAWSTFTAQFFSLYFRQPEHVRTGGHIVSQKERLVVRSVSFGLVEVCLGLLAALSLILGLAWPRVLVPRDPSSIAGLASMLSGSRYLMAQLKGTGIATKPLLNDHLASMLFWTTAVDRDKSTLSSLVIECSSPKPNNDIDGNVPGPGHVKWYLPISSRRFFQIGLPALLIALIGTLEALLHQSRVGNGLANVSNPASYEHYYWTFLPAIGMVGITSLVGMLHDSSKILSPYAALSTGPKNAKATVMRRPFGFFSVWSDLAEGEMGSVLPALAVLTASLLAVVVSGLYTAVSQPVAQRFLLRQADWFADHTTGSNESPLQIDGILVGNLSYPQYTYDTLAISQPEKSYGTLNGSLEVVLPSIRGRMNCKMLPPDSIKVEVLPEGSTQHVSAPQQIIVWIKYSGWSFFPKLDNMVFQAQPPWGSFVVRAPRVGHFGGLLYIGGQCDRPGPCPSYYGVLGAVNEHQVESTSFFTCDPVAEKVLATVNFALPGMTIDPSRPPVVDENTSEAIYVRLGGTSGSPLGLFMDPDQVSQPESVIFVPSSKDVIGGFMRTLVYGSRGIPLAELTGPENGGRLLSAVNHLYGLAFAQLMNNYRIPATASNSSILKGTITTSGEYRLMQSPISTHILAVLLSIILVSIVIHMVTVKSRGVVPKNPCSIAAVASLVADSAFLDMMQPESQTLSDKELMEKFDGYMFSMGWWAGAEGEVGRRRFGIDFGTAEHLR